MPIPVVHHHLALELLGSADGTDDELIKFEGVPDEGVPDEGVPDQVKSTVSNLSCLCAL